VGYPAIVAQQGMQDVWEVCSRTPVPMLSEPSDGVEALLNRQCSNGRLVMLQPTSPEQNGQGQRHPKTIQIY